MSEKVKPNPDAAPTHDAQLAAENIVSGAEKAPEVDFAADYAAAQQFSVSEIDRTGEGEAAAAAATAPQYEIPDAAAVKTEAESTGNPQDYIEIAEEIGNSREAVTNVSDDLVQQALEKGQPTKK